MSKYLFFLILSITFNSLNLVFAQVKKENHAYILGGGGEPRSNSSTIFDSTLRTVGERLKSSNWPVTVRFNGGHVETEKIIAEQFGRENAGGFNPKAFTSTLADIKKKMLATTDPNAQVLIVIDSHGAMRIDATNEKTHSISASQSEGGLDLNSLKGSNTVSLDELKEITELAEKKNIRLGIVDLSCHSGATLKLANKKTCVVTGSADNLYSYVNFGDQFFSKIKPGSNLEDIFLSTRREHKANSLPQISTEAGIALSEMEKNGLDSFLFYFRPTSNYGKLQDLLPDEATQAINCSPSGLRLERAISKLEAAVRSAGVANIDTIKLRAKLEKYRQVQFEIETTLKSWGATELQNNESFEVVETINGRKIVHRLANHTWESILTGAWKTNEAYFRDLSNKEKDPKMKLDLIQSADLMKQIALRKDEITKRHPSLENYSKKAKELIKTTEKTYELAAEVAQAEREVYQQIYSAHTKQSGGVNACKEFKF